LLIWECLSNSEPERGHDACEIAEPQSADKPLRRRGRFKGNFACRQILKKVAGVAAIVVNCNSIISLSHQSILKLRDKSVVSMWHEEFLNCV